MSEDWKKEFLKEFRKKTLLDRLNLSVNELSELGIGWLIISFIILYLSGVINILINEGRIPNSLILYLFIIGISFFTHELTHKFTAIRFGAKAYFRLSKEGLFITLLSLLIGIPILAVGAVFWWGEASASTGIRGRVSSAGPISNIVLAGLFLVIQGLGGLLGGSELLLFLLEPTSSIGLLFYFIGSRGVYLNVFLGIFNLLPIGVLDGAKVLAWDGRIWLALIGSLLALGIFGGSFFLFF